eukprot:scaffold431_cov334-Pavlova_lutheri.AAC.14
MEKPSAWIDRFVSNLKNETTFPLSDKRYTGLMYHMLHSFPLSASPTLYTLVGEETASSEESCHSPKEYDSKRPRQGKRIPKHRGTVWRNTQ